ncbi:MAG TPA: hypothetical protein PKE06_09865 [Flavilitoribacter sp.]|nr:hypothetical protein [Flavilitoribacter sp.]HMQ91211.1 hypothetical protein [Flavilitoribacter sp.]
MKKNVLILLGVAAMASCGNPEDQNDTAVKSFVEEKVLERLNNYRRIIEKNCREKALEEAGMMADSILIAAAREQRDSMDRPEKPEKPERPELKRPAEELPLKPLFRDTVKGNGNNR